MGGWWWWWYNSCELCHAGEMLSLAHLGLTRLGQKNLKNRVMNSFVVEEVDDLVEAQQKKNEQEGVEELSTEELMRENNALVKVWGGD